MAQFDAVRLRGSDLVVILQSDVVDYLPTRLVAPLLPIDQVPSIVPRVNPRIVIDGDEFVLVTHLAATVPVHQLQRVEASLAAHEYAIRGAIDMLISGF